MTPHRGPQVWLVRGLGVLLAAIIAYLVVRIVLGLLQPESLYRPVENAAAPIVANAQMAQKARYDFSSDPFRFGSAPLGSDTPILALGDDAPETTLKIVMTGLVSGQDGGVNLKTPDGQEQLFHVDDAVLDGVTLRAINPSYVVLDVDGELQRLTFVKDDDEQGLIRTAERPALNGTNANAVPRLNAQTFLREFSLTPQREDGRSIGLKITARRNPALLKQFGFQTGDVLTAIGSTDLTKGRPNIPALINQFSNAQSANVTVLRNGQLQMITIGQ